jgi:hypothetical protein
LLTNPQQLERPVQQLLLRLAELAPEETAQGLSNEIETVRDPNVRACLLALVAECRLPAEKAQELARALLQELTREELREINRQKLGYNLIRRLGEPAMGPLLEAFPAALPRQKLVLIPFLDALCVDSPVPPHHKVKVAEMLLAAAQAGDRNVRLTASRARVFHDAAVPERLRAQLARMLAQDISAYTHPDTLASLGDSLERLAASSVAPLFELVREDHRRPSADRAIRILARITVFRRAELTEGAALRSQLLHFLKALVQEASPSGGFLWALGLLASCEDVETTECREIADLLKGRLGKVPHHAELLDALGYVATRPSLPLPDRIEIARIFSTLMGEHEEGVDEILRRRETAEGIEYEFGPRAEFDSVALPVVVDAVRRICLSPATTDALRRQLLDRAIEVWDKVASWTVVWGPRSSEALANALGEIGSMAALDPAQRIRVARALGRDIKRISVVRALAALSKTPDESSEMNETLVEAGLAVLNHWMDSDIAPEERLIVLQSVATIAARAQLRRTKHVRLLRKAVAQHLLNGLREGQYWATEPLEKLRDAGAVPRELAREVETALRAALAIAKR